MRRLIQILILTTLICSTPFIAFADCQVTLHWGTSTDSAIAGYRLYLRTEFNNYDYESFEWQGYESQCTVPALDENTVYYFVIRAFDVEGSESSDSNEVRFYYQDTLNPSGNDYNDYASLVNNDPAAGSSVGCFISSVIGK
jgi:hypothetical protein